MLLQFPKMMLLSMLLLPANAGKFMEFQGVKTATSTPLGDASNGDAASCKFACEQEMSCDCALFDPIGGSCKMQSGCLYFHPDYVDGGTLELYIKLPQYLWPFTVYPGTTANSDTQDVVAKTGITQRECTNLCLQRSDCQCAVLRTKDRWSSADDRCQLKSNCQPTGFKKEASLAAFMTFVKESPDGILLSDAGAGSSGSIVLLIICLVLLLVLAVAVTVVLLCFLRGKGRAYRAVLQDLTVPKEEKPRSEYAKEQLMNSFARRNGMAYLSSLELALEAKVSKYDIPLVYSVHKVPETFKPPKIDASVTSLSVQLCFVLDYTGSMKTQIAQAKDSVTKIIESMKKLKIASLPNAAVDVEMAAVAYFDWDTETRKLGRPVVSVFGGGEVKEEHSETLTPEKFCQLGGTWTRDTSALQKWINQGLGHGGKVPEELTGALLAAANLEWTADEKLMVVITDAPCHGKDYSSADHDSFCDKTTGLTCTGRPEEPLQSLMAQGVTSVILHTGESAAVSMCKKLQQTDPRLVHEKVSPSQTAQRVISVLEDKVQVQPLTYVLKPLSLPDEAPTSALICQSPVTDPNLATNVNLDMDVGGTKESLAVGSDGLLFVGSNKSNPKVTLNRAADSQLDEWFQSTSDQVELDRAFDPTQSYLLKMPIKSSAE